MERLTSKETREKITNRLMPYQFNADVTITQKQFFDMYDKLLAFEDFMEEQVIESLEELKLRIEYYKDTIDNQKFNYNELHKYKNKLQQENQTLKGNWEKLREWLMEFGIPMRELVVSDDETKYIYVSDILDEMQELEGGDGRNKQ